MGYSLDNDLYVANLDSFIMLSQGIHQIVIMDSNRCISDTAITTIGNTFHVWMTATPPCLTPGGTSTLNSGIIEPVIGPRTYSYNSSPFSATSTYTVNTAGTYTVQVKDMYGCTATQTAIVNPIPNPGMTLSAPPGCIWPFGSTTITATVTSGGPYLFQIKAPGSGWSTPQIGNTFGANVVGTYEVRVSDSNGCYSIPAKIDIGDCSHCLPNLPPNAQWYINSVSSSSFPGGTIPTTPIVIDSILYVDGNLDIWNNPNVYLTYSGKIIMTNSTTPSVLSIKNSTLQPCYYWWHGIFASNDKQSIKIENNSTLKYMVASYTPVPSAFNTPTGGVNVCNGATITSTDSRYENDWYGIRIANAGVFSGKIERNTFTFNDPLLDPVGEGISIQNVEDATVGGLLTNVNDGNLFENLSSGISIGAGGNYMPSPLVSNIRIYNNRFNNIKDPTTMTTGIFRDQVVLSSTYSVWTYAFGYLSSYGSAITTYSDKGYHGNTSIRTNLTVEVKNLTNSFDDSYTFFPGIYDCDRGIVTGNTNLVADKIRIDNTFLAIMNQSIVSKYYQISNNFINNAHYGIQVAAPIGMSVITGNIVNTRNYAIPWLWTYTTPNLTYYKSPVGIDVTHMYQNNSPGPVYNYLDNNTVNIPYITGSGISVTKGDQHQYVGKNTINFGTMSIAPDYWHTYKALYGLSLYSCQGSLIDQNSIFGMSNKTVFDARNAIGVYFEDNKKCIVNCNRAKYTRYGFYAWGDNTTASTNITFNKFSGNKFPWYFLDAGATLPGTFGNVGNGSVDNGNNFLGTVNRLNSNQFKVFRNSSVPSPASVITLPTFLNFSESGSSGFGTQYGVLNPVLTPSADPCLDPLFIVGPGDNDNSDENTEEIEDIISDSIDYIDHQDVAAWLGEKHAYEALAEDSTLRYSSLEMQNFYTSHQNSLIGKIYDAERAIKLLIDSTTNISNFESRFENAISLNDLISGGEEWEQNEHDLNSIYLKLISNSNIDTIGYDTIQIDSTLTYFSPIVQQISSFEKDYLRNLAYSCPYVAGSSVYRARTLWAMFDPSAFYDDRVLCLSSSGRNSYETDVDIDSLYESQIENLSYTKPIVNTHILKDGGEVLIYPNPANSSIIIEYTCQTNGKFELSNSMGQVVYSTELSGGKKKVLLQVHDLTSGVYFYKCKFESCEDTYGKLIIEK